RCTDPKEAKEYFEEASEWSNRAPRATLRLASTDIKLRNLHEAQTLVGEVLRDSASSVTEIARGRILLADIDVKNEKVNEAKLKLNSIDPMELDEHLRYSILARRELLKLGDIEQYKKLAEDGHSQEWIASVIGLKSGPQYVGLYMYATLAAMTDKRYLAAS